MNAQLPPNLSVRGKHFARFLQSTNCVSLTQHQLCQGPKFTFLPNQRCPGTLIDHICVTFDFMEYVKTCRICDYVDINRSDHLPVILTINIHIPYIQVNTRSFPR